jgi:hypothetical protein
MKLLSAHSIRATILNWLADTGSYGSLSSDFLLDEVVYFKSMGEPSSESPTELACFWPGLKKSPNAETQPSAWT